MICLHYKYKPWEVDELTYVEYKDFVKELGILFNFESIKGLIGNCYAQDAMTAINGANPLNYEEVDQSKPKRMTKEMAMAFMGMKQ